MAFSNLLILFSILRIHFIRIKYPHEWSVRTHDHGTENATSQGNKNNIIKLKISMAVKIYVIESLNEPDRFTGKEIYQDLLRWESEKNRNIHTSYKDIISKNDFFSWLSKIHTGLNKDDEVILQLEMHGDANKSGIILSNGELICWGELLPIFNTIKRTCSVFHLFMATCFGNYIGQLLLGGTFPFTSFTGTESEINENQIIEDYTQIYSHFFREGSLYKAVEKIESLRSDSQIKTKDSQTLIECLLLSIIETHIRNTPLKELSQIISKMFGINFEENANEEFREITMDYFIQVITDFFQKTGTNFIA